MILILKNSTGFQFGVFTEIDLITFYIRPEIKFNFFKIKKCCFYKPNSLDESINIAEHSYKSTDIQLPIIFGYKVFGPISVFGWTFF